MIDKGGVFPYNTSAWNTVWAVTGYNINYPEQIIIGISDNGVPARDGYAFSGKQGFAFTAFQVKEDATSGKDFKFEYIRPSNLIPGEHLVTMGVQADSAAIPLAIYDSVNLSVEANLSLSSVTATTEDVTTPFDLTFNSSDKSYNLVVGPTVDEINLEVTAENASTILASDVSTLTSSNGVLSGTYELDSDNDTFTFYIQNGHDIEIFTVNITRLSGDASLDSLTISNTDFNYSTSTSSPFNLEVPYTTTSVVINASTNGAIVSGLSTISGDGKSASETWNLTNTGASINTKTIRVNAPNCAYSTALDNTCIYEDYVINITREAASTTSSLDNINVSYNDGTDKSKDYANPNTTVTLDNVKNVVDNIDLTFTPTDSLISKILVNGTEISGLSKNVSLADGDNTITVKVYAQDNEEENATTYTLNIRRMSNAADITSLTITPKDEDGNTVEDGGSLNDTFTSGTTSYTYTYDRSVKKLDVTGAVSTGATTSGFKEYNVTETPITISITAEDGTTNSYEITLEEIISTTSSLDNINVSYTENIAKTKDYENPNTTVTLDNVKNVVDNIDLTFTPTDELISKILVNGTEISGLSTNVSLADGDNSITVKVYGQDNTEENATTYTLNIRRMSNAADITSLTITPKDEDDNTVEDGGSLDKTFTSGTTSYTYTYDRSVKKIDITGAVSTGAITSGFKEYNVTETPITISITAEDGTTNSYEITLEQGVSNDATLGSLSVKNNNSHEYITSFDADNETYTINVEHDIDTLSVLAVPNSEHYKVSETTNLTGTIDLDSDEAFTTGVEYEIHVVAEDGTTTKTYTITVTRNKGTSAYLTDLKVNNETVSKSDLTQFSKTDTGLYELSVGYDVTSVPLLFTKEDSYATTVVSVTNEDGTTTITDGNIPLIVGENLLKVNVTSQDENDAKEYQVSITRYSNSDSITVEIDSNTVTEIDSTTNTYTYKYDRDASSLNVVVTAASGANITVINGEGLTVTGNNVLSGTYNTTVIDGVNTYSNITFSVLPSGGEVKNYVIHFEQILDTDNTLDELKVWDIDADMSTDEPYTLTKVDEENYTLSVDANISKVIISAHANSSYVKDIKITGTSYNATSATKEINVASGSHDYTVEVFAENNDKKTYTINITRPVNENSSLSDLRVGSGVDTPTTIDGFDAGEADYNYTVSSNVSSVTIEAIGVNNTEVKITDGNNNGNESSITVNLAVGETKTIEIEVESESGDSSTYSVTLRRQNNVAEFTSLTSGTENCTLTGSGLNYTLDVPYGIDNVTLDYTLADGASIVSPSSLEDIDITSIDSILIEIRAEDPGIEHNTYTVTLNKLGSTNVTPVSVTALDQDDNEITLSYDEATHTYTGSVLNDVTKVKVNVVTASDGQTVSGDVDTYKDLSIGETSFDFNVTAGDATTNQDYSVVITKSAKSDVTLSDLKLSINEETASTIEGFQNNKITYDITVPFTTKTIDVTPTLNDSDAGIDEVINQINFTGDTASLSFTVRAEDTTTTEVYTINFTRSTNEVQNVKVFDTDATWDNDEKEYVVSVEGNNDTINLDVSTELEITLATGASIKAQDVSKDLEVGANTYLFTVTDTLGNDIPYKLIINRAASIDNTIASIKATLDNGESANAIATSTEGNYILTIPEDTSTHDVEVTPTFSEATVVVSEIENNEFTVYVTSESSDMATYNVTIKNPSTSSDEITSNDYGHEINDEYIETVSLDTTASEIKEQLDNVDTSLEIWTADESEKINDDDLLATGMIVKLIVDGNEKDRKIIVIKGDTDGGGTIDLFDAVKILNHTLGNEFLTGPYMEAAYVDENTEIDLFDAVKILNHTLGVSLLY